MFLNKEPVEAGPWQCEDRWWRVLRWLWRPGRLLWTCLLILAFTGRPAILDAVEKIDLSAIEARLLERPSVSDLVEFAYLNNPSIKAAREQWRAKVERFRIETSYPDPQVMGTYFPEPIETRLGPQDWNLTVSQMIPFPGKLSKKGEMVRSEARVARLELDKAVREVIANICESAYELQYIREARRVVEENSKLVDHLRILAESAFAEDKAAFVDVTKAQSQVAQLAYDGILLDELYETEVARLNALLNREAGSALGEIRDEPFRPLVFSLEEIYRLAEANQEEILMAGALVEKAEANKDLARLQFLPDFKLGFFYAGIGEPDVPTPPRDAGRDALGVQAGVSIPLWLGKNSGLLREADALTKKAQALKDARIKDTEAMIRSVYFRLNNAKRLIDLYAKQLLPQAAQSMEVAETWVREGQGSLSDFVETEAVWYNFQLSLARARADYGKFLTRLERLAGRSLTVREENATDAVNGEKAE